MGGGVDSRAPHLEFGIQFFPAIGPAERAANDYFRDCLELVSRAEDLGYTHVRIVEHYFHSYGGYSPDPLVFLAAASQRTTKLRLIAGAVLPVFNHPLKLAGQIGMVDAISDGRLEVGFARAFVPHEFQRFDVDLDESRARFDEGISIVAELLEHEDVSFLGKFHQFPPTTSLPRPTQLPRPPFWVAALATESSFVKAAQMGHSVMAIPLAGAAMGSLIKAYRDAWHASGHPGEGRVMLAFHMFCHEDAGAAVAIAREPLNCYLRCLVNAAVHWTTGTSSSDYPGYDKIIDGLSSETFESQVEKGAALVGTPDQIAEQIRGYREEVGSFEIASLQVNFFDLPLDAACRSLDLFGREVIPRFAAQPTP